MSIGKNMLLIKSAYMKQNSFSLIPVSNDCPYMEVMFDPAHCMLVPIGKTKKETFRMMTKVNADGDPIRLKTPKVDPKTGQPVKMYKEERVKFEALSEYYINDIEDIKLFIELFAINSDNFDYKSFLHPPTETKVSPIITKV